MNPNLGLLPDAWQLRLAKQARLDETRAAWNYMLKSTRSNRQKYATLHDKAVIQSLQERLHEAHQTISSLQSQVAEIHSSGRLPQVKSLGLSSRLTQVIGCA